MIAITKMGITNRAGLGDRMNMVGGFGRLCFFQFVQCSRECD